MGNLAPSRRYRSYENCPLPTIADKLLFILTYLKQNPIQEVQGQLFGMSQSECEQVDSSVASGIESSLSGPSITSVPYTDDLTAMLATPPSEASAPSSLFFMMGRNAPSSVRKTQGAARVL